MSKYSSDSDSSLDRKKSKKYRRRSSSSSSSGSKYSSRKKCKKYKQRRSRSKDKRLKYSRKKDEDRSRRRRSTSNSDSPRNRRRRSTSNSDSPRNRRRRSTSNSDSPRNRRRRSRSRSPPKKSSVRSKGKKNDGSELLDRMNKAAVQAMAENSKLRETQFGSVTAPVDRESLIDEINSPSFAPKTFLSTASDKVKMDDIDISDVPLPQYTSSAPKDQDSLLHPNLLLDDPDEKLNRWVKKIFQIRQRSINGDPMTSFG